MFSLRLWQFLAITLLFTVGCSAQSTTQPASPERDRKIKNQLRTSFNLPPSVDITLGETKPSKVEGYDELPITLTNGERTQTFEFLISKDGSTLARLDKIDLTKDPSGRIDISGRPVRGNKDAKVTIINYDDFQCPFCARMHETLFQDVMKTYGDRVQVVYKDFPLVAIHPWATHASVNANCLAAQNGTAYWEYADWVHANLQQINASMAAAKDTKAADSRKAPQEQGGRTVNLAGTFAMLDQAALEQAKKHGLEMNALKACIEKQDESAVVKSIAEGDALGVASTPTLFINGEKVEGAIPPDALKMVLDRALRDAGVEPPASREAAAGSEKAAPAAPASRP